MKWISLTYMSDEEHVAIDTAINFFISQISQYLEERFPLKGGLEKYAVFSLANIPEGFQAKVL